MNSQIDSYLAKLNLEGNRGIWLGNRRKIDFILNKIEPYLKEECKICEIGIGDGYLLDKLYELKMDCTGIDISEYLVTYHKNKVLEQNKKIELIHANIVDLTFKISLFNAVFCIDILEHLTEDDYLQSLKNIYAMLKPGGIFVGSFPYMENLDKSMMKCPKCGHEFHRVGHKQIFDSEKIKNTIMPYFKIKEIDEVKLNSTVNTCSKTPFYKRNFSMIGLIKKIGKASLYSFKNRNKSYNSKSKEINISSGATCYFIAEKV